MTAHRRRTAPPIDRPAGPANPFEVFLLAICAIQGAAVLTGAARPTSIETALTPPPILRTLWATLLVLGGVLVIAGLYWRDPFTGVEIKRVGFVAAGFGTLAYGVALVLAGAPGLVAAAYNLAFTAACAARLVQVTRRLTAARAHVNAIRRRNMGGETSG